MSDLRKFSGRSCSNSSQSRPDECELIVDQIDDPSVSNTQCLTTAAEPKSWNDIFSNLSKGNDNGSSASGRESNPTGPVPSVNIRRKILTMRRKLLLDLKRLHSALTDYTSPDHFFEHELPYFGFVEESYENLLRTLDSLNDVEFKKEMFEGIVDSFEQCSKLFENCQTRFLEPINKRAETNFDKEEEDEIKASDSASQIGVSTSIVSKKTDFAQQIEFERKRTEIESTEEITKARKARLLAEAEEAESLAKLRLEKANLEAEEKLAAFEGSSILSTSTKIKSFSSSRSRARRNISNLRVKSENAAKLEHCAEQRIEPEPLPVKPKVPIVRKRLVKTTELKPYEVMNRLNDLCLNDMVPENVQIFGSRDWQTTASRQVSGVNVNPFNQLNENRENVNEKTSNPVKNYMASHMKVKSESGSHELPQRPQVNEVANNNDLILRTYLDRQGRNEYITLASQIGYDGNNIAFVFYENQIRRLMSESPFEERRLEVLRASCVGQPREMVNLFCVPMKNMSTSRRIEKALDRLRQRYGVSGGLTSEPKVMAVRNGPKVSFTSTSLKLFNEDLNTLEVFAYAHDEVEKLSGQLLIDTANRLPSLLKRRYLDYLNKRNLNLNSPGFDSLRDFVVHELNTMTSDYAQSVF